MILKADIDGVASYDVGDEIWQFALSDAIQAEAECIVYSAGSELLESGHNQLRDRIVAEMSQALSQVDDTYRAPDGVLYSLIEPSAVEDDDGTRRAVVRRSDGTEGEGLKWYGDLCGCPHNSPYSER
jgi:hypothetical protein